MRILIFLLPFIATALPIHLELPAVEVVIAVPPNLIGGDLVSYSGITIDIDLEQDVVTRAEAGTVTFEARPIDWTGQSQNVEGNPISISFDAQAPALLNGVYHEYPRLEVAGHDIQTRGSTTRQVQFFGLHIGSHLDAPYFDLGDRWRLTFEVTRDPIFTPFRAVKEGESFTETMYTDMLLTRAAPVPEPGTAMLGTCGLLFVMRKYLPRFRASRRDERYPVAS